MTKLASSHLILVRQKLSSLLILLRPERRKLATPSPPLLDAAESDEQRQQDNKASNTSSNANLGALGKRSPAVLDAMRFSNLSKSLRLLALLGRDNLDLLPVARRIHAFPRVLLDVAGRIVLRVDLLDRHLEGLLAEVGFAASPLHDARVVVLGVAAGPDAEADVHGRLGVVGALEGVGEFELAQLLAVDPPLDAVLGPVDGVVVEVVLRVREGEVCAAITVGDVT